MRYFRTGDPDADFMIRDMEQTMYEARLPVCDCCGEIINADFYWEIDGDILCEDCMNDRFRHYTDDYAQVD